MEQMYNQKLLTWLFGILCLYIISLTASVAGMEMGAFLITLTSLYLTCRTAIRKQDLSYLRFQGDYFLFGFVFFILLGAVFISDLTSFEQREIVRSSRFILTFYALTVALWTLKVHAPERFQNLLKFLFFCMLIVSSYGIIQFFSGIDIFRKTPYTLTIFDGSKPALFRVKGFYTNTMSYSYIMGMLFCVLAAFWHFNALKFKNVILNKCFMSITALTVLMSVFMTFTRGIWIALIAGLVVMAFLVSRKLFLRVSIGIVLIFGLSFAVSPGVRNLVDGLINLDSSNSERVLIWKNHWAMFKDHPMLGIGFEQNGRLMQEYNLKLYGKEWRVVHAHNHFLQILTGVGIFGFICFLLFSAGTFWLALRMWLNSAADDAWTKSVALGSIGAQIVFHVGGLSEAVFVDRESNHAFLFILALTLVTAQAFMSSQKSHKSRAINT